MAQINLNLDGQRLFATQSVLASDTIDYITVQVKHTTDWDDCSIWAHFENGEEHYAVEVINQRIEADKHLNLCRGVWKVWCVGFAFSGEDLKCRITSTVETIHVQQTGGLDGDPLPEIPPSESEQILGIAISAKEAAQNAKDAADEIPARINSALTEAKASGEFDGADGADGEDGGYYTPEVTQPEANTLQFDFAPSKPDMPVVEPVQVKLPTPESGENADLTGYATEQYVREYAQPVGDYALKNEIPTVPVKSVNGKTGAVSLTASDVGALPSTYTPPNQTAVQVGADPKGTAATAVSQHNTSVDSHNDIRLELKAINDRLTAFFDSDDQTLDELSEIVAYITSNKALIDSITTSKVSVADIINNLTTNVTNKPLSAAQGVALKGLIDGLTSGKLDASKLPEAINTALAQAKASGEFDGADGTDGSNGKDGTSVTVKSVNESTEDGGSNVVTFSDGKAITIRNGRKGSDGPAGADGKTPVKGTDYYTAADKAEMVNAVIAALPVYTGEVV